MGKLTLKFWNNFLNIKGYRIADDPLLIADDADTPYECSMHGLKTFWFLSCCSDQFSH